MDCKSSLGRLCFLHTALQTNEVLESAYGEFQNSSCGAETPWMPIMQWRESLEYSSLNLFIFDCFILLWVEGKDGTVPRRLPGGRGVKPRRVISQLERHIQGPTSVHICGPFKVISSLCVFTLRGRKKNPLWSHGLLLWRHLVAKLIFECLVAFSFFLSSSVLVSHWLKIMTSPIPSSDVTALL